MLGVTGGRRQRGFALLLVLWSLVLLSFITSRLIAAGRSEAKLAANLRASAAAEMLADAAVHEAAFHLLDGSAAWPTDGRRQVLTLPGGAVVLRLQDQAGKVNPNQASEALLQALLRGVGADAGAARSIAAAIMDWRTLGSSARPYGAKAAEYRAAGRDYGPPNAPFRSVDELGLVLGMTPVLLAQLAPHLTVFYEGDPDPDIADPVVLQTLREATGQANLGGGGGGGNRVVAITAEATERGGAQYVRRAVLRIGSGTDGRPYQVLDWRRGDL